MLNVVLGGAWGSSFKRSLYMTSSEARDDPQQLVRVKILGFAAHSFAAHSGLSPEHIRI